MYNIEVEQAMITMEMESYSSYAYNTYAVHTLYGICTHGSMEQVMITMEMESLAPLLAT